MSEGKFLLDKEAYCVFGRSLLGLLGLYLGERNSLLRAAVVMVLCVWADAITGWLARRSGPKSPSTSAVEAYADFLCFVLLPLQFIYRISLSPGDWGIQIFLPLFLLAGIYRLARFQLEGLVPGKGYRGLPVTYNGYLFPLFGLVSHYFPGAAFGIGVLFIAVISYLMTTTRLVVPEI